MNTCLARDIQIILLTQVLGLIMRGLGLTDPLLVLVGARVKRLCQGSCGGAQAQLDQAAPVVGPHPWEHVPKDAVRVCPRHRLGAPVAFLSQIAISYYDLLTSYKNICPCLAPLLALHLDGSLDPAVATSSLPSGLAVFPFGHASPATDSKAAAPVGDLIQVQEAGRELLVTIYRQIQSHATRFLLEHRGQ